MATIIPNRIKKYYRLHKRLFISILVVIVAITVIMVFVYNYEPGFEYHSYVGRIFGSTIGPTNIPSDDPVFVLGNNSTSYRSISYLNQSGSSSYFSSNYSKLYADLNPSNVVFNNFPTYEISECVRVEGHIASNLHPTAVFIIFSAKSFRSSFISYLVLNPLFPSAQASNNVTINQNSYGSELALNGTHGVSKVMSRVQLDNVSYFNFRQNYYNFAFNYSTVGYISPFLSNSAKVQNLVVNLTAELIGLSEPVYTMVSIHISIPPYYLMRIQTPPPNNVSVIQITQRNSSVRYVVNPYEIDSGNILSFNAIPYQTYIVKCLLTNDTTLVRTFTAGRPWGENNSFFI
ncbi:MAG: hypothetical protein LVQ96_02630 [Thermoplasmatales archaeon]|nr:hypothetical protein [Thermoplasmatales archaeon]MCW6170047.1 hypothetical protein [Thermoplasmatales archaeon]